MKTRYSRGLLSLVAAMAMAVAACSKPAAEPPAASAPPTSPPSQSTPPVAADQVAAPPTSQPAGAPAPTAEAAAPSVSQPAPTPAPPATASPAAAPPATAAPAPPPPKPKVARLQAGRELTIRTTRVLSTKTMKTGDAFSAILEEPIRVEDWVVAPSGARVEGRIVEADDGGRLKGKAKLSIELTSLTTGDGQKVEIVTSPVGAEAATSRGKDATKIGVGAGAGAAVGAIAGGGKGAAIGALIGGGAGAAMRGAAAEIAAESVVSFVLRSPVTIRARKSG